MTQAGEALPDDPETLKAMLIAERQRTERLVQIIKDLQRHRFGRRAESLPDDQLLLALEDVEQGEAGAAAETEAKSPAARAEGARKRRANAEALRARAPATHEPVAAESPRLGSCPSRLGQVDCRGHLEPRAARLSSLSGAALALRRAQGPNPVGWCVRAGRIHGILGGLAGIPRHIWRHRRAP